MRHSKLLALVFAMAVGGTAAAYAQQAVEADPATVPLGVLADHSRVANISTQALLQATRRNRADVTVQHVRLEANQATGWHTHPGPGLVTVVRGSLVYEDASDGECRESFYPAGRGFMDRGFGHVHRALAGEQGADFYVVYIHPRGAGATAIPASEPAECAES
jgi:hypothetical protein